MCVLFTPKDFTSIALTLSIFLRALAITDLVILTLSPIFAAMNSLSVPFNPLNTCSTALSSEYDNVPSTD